MASNDIETVLSYGDLDIKRGEVKENNGGKNREEIKLQQPRKRLHEEQTNQE